MKKTLLIAALVGLLVSGSSFATTVSEPSSPHMTVRNAVILDVLGLTPGQFYDVTVMVYGSEDDPAPYCLGYGGSFINSRGRLTLDYDLEDLRYASGREPFEVKVWLRPAGSGCAAAPALDPDGVPLYAEYDFY